MKFYHGTSTEAFLKIKEEGFNCPATNWNCSDDTRVYLAGIDLDKYAPEEREEYKEAIHNEYMDAFQMAFDASQVAAAVINSKYDYTVVLEFDISDEDIVKYVTDDDSCENMYNCYEITEDDLNYLIRSGRCKVRTHQILDGYQPFKRVFFIPVDNQYFTERAVSADVLKFAEFLRKNNVYIEEAYEYWDDAVCDGFTLSNPGWTVAEEAS